MKKRHKNKWSKKQILPVLVIAGLVLGLFLWQMNSRRATAVGREYLHAQTQLEPQEIAAKLQEKKSAELKEMIETGKIDVISAFDDFALFGDSRAYGFESYGILDPASVYAGAGNTIMNITDEKETIAQRKPSKLIFSYGVNDMGLEIGGGEENGYANTYEQQIDQLLAVDPDAKVFVCSIIDVTPEAKERSPRWDKAANFNAQIKAMCEKRGWTYVDNDPLGTDLSHYQSDGVHFTSGFTWDWARNIAKTMWETIYGTK